MEESGSSKVCVVMVDGWRGSVAVENLHGGGFTVVIVTACYEDSYVELVLVKMRAQCRCGDEFRPAKLCHRNLRR